MTKEFSWQNSISLCPASFCTPTPKLPITQVFLDFLICVPKKTSFLVLVLEGLVGHHRTGQFHFFVISDWSIDLDCCDVEWFALEMNQDHSVVFEIAPKYCILESFVDYESYSISSKGFLPIVVDIKVI